MDYCGYVKTYSNVGSLRLSESGGRSQKLLEEDNKARYLAKKIRRFRGGKLILTGRRCKWKRQCVGVK